LNVQVSKTKISATLTGYAYETIPNKPIIAGKTEGAASEGDEEGFDAGASLTTHPIPDAPLPVSLGMLSLGAKGVPLWRRSESVADTSENK
jgi:hypothetical protein